MSRTFDYGGRVVSASHPVKALKTVKKTLLIDSADRDTTKYYTNGDFVVYLPRVYENVVSMRLAAAEFPPLVTVTPTVSFVISGNITVSNGVATVPITNSTSVKIAPGSSVSVYTGSATTVYTILTVPSTTSFTVATTSTTNITVSGSPTATIMTPGGLTHQFTYGQTNLASTTFSNDAVVPAGTYYFLLDVEGMNKVDELAVGGNKSTFVDSYFAKIPALSSAYNSGTFIEYNDHQAQENIARYSPAIGKLDRLHIRTRLHNQKDSNIGVLYWTGDGAIANGSTTSPNTGANYNLTLEIEYLDNVFDDFSALETHLTART